MSCYQETTKYKVWGKYKAWQENVQVYLLTVLKCHDAIYYKVCQWGSAFHTLSKIQHGQTSQLKKSISWIEAQWRCWTLLLCEMEQLSSVDFTPGASSFCWPPKIMTLSEGWSHCSIFNTKNTSHNILQSMKYK